MTMGHSQVPGTGYPEEIGSEAGFGFDVNVYIAFSGCQNYQRIPQVQSAFIFMLILTQSLPSPLLSDFALKFLEETFEFEYP